MTVQESQSNTKSTENSWSQHAWCKGDYAGGLVTVSETTLGPECGRSPGQGLTVGSSTSSDVMLSWCTVAGGLLARDILEAASSHCHTVAREAEVSRAWKGSDKRS